MDLDDPAERRQFRKRLSEAGPSQVRHMLATDKYSLAKAAVADQWLKDVASGETVLDDMAEVADKLEALQPKFVMGSNITGKFLPTKEQGDALGLFTEAISLVERRFGASSRQVAQLEHTINEGSGGFTGGPSSACVTDSVALLRSYIRIAERMPATPPPAPAHTPQIQKPHYVDPKRLEEIEAVKSAKWDLTRLARLCVELNEAWGDGHYISTAALVRIIIDHVPPILGCKGFSEVANNYAGSKSFKESMTILHESMRKIGDGQLHTQARQTESLPTATQVDVKRELDLLLGEVVRVAKGP